MKKMQLIFLVFLISIVSSSAQSKYEGNALFSLQGITEGSDAFKELIDSLGPFQVEEFPGGIMKKYTNKTNGVSLTLYNRERVNSPGKTYHLSEMTLSLGLSEDYFTGLLPLDIFTIVNQKEQLQILKSKDTVTIIKKKSHKGYIYFEYSGYKNSRLKGPLKFSLSYMDGELYQLVISN